MTINRNNPHGAISYHWTERCEEVYCHMLERFATYRDLYLSTVARVILKTNRVLVCLAPRGCASSLKYTYLIVPSIPHP